MQGVDERAAGSPEVLMREQWDHPRLAEVLMREQ